MREGERERDGRGMTRNELRERGVQGALRRFRYISRERHAAAEPLLEYEGWRAQAQICLRRMNNTFVLRPAQTCTVGTKICFVGALHPEAGGRERGPESESEFE